MNSNSLKDQSENISDNPHLDIVKLEQKLEAFMERKYKNNKNRMVWSKRSLSQRIKENGYLEMLGNKVIKPKELFVYNRIYKESQFENVRIVYLRESKIIGAEGILVIAKPNSCNQGLNLNQRLSRLRLDKIIKNIKNSLSSLNADGYFIVNNHTDDMKIIPSAMDKEFVQYVTGQIAGYKGQFIMNSQKFIFIPHKSYLFFSGTELNKKHEEQNQLKRIFAEELYKDNSCLLSFRILQKTLKNYVLAFFINHKNRIVAVRELNERLFENSLKTQKHLFKIKECVNAKSVYCLTPCGSLFEVYFEGQNIFNLIRSLKYLKKKNTNESHEESSSYFKRLFNSTNMS